MAQMKYYYELTISSSPHMHSPVTTQTIMRDVLIALAPALIGSVFLFGPRALLVTLVSAAAAVSFAGLLGFVGLMVPHMARTLEAGGGLRRQIPLCALLGSTLTVLADLLGRVLFAPSQLPAGIITAVLGAPFFFVLLLQRRSRL